MWRSVRNFLLLLFLTFLGPVAGAVTLDWDAQTWTAGTFTNSYNVDPASPGNDITLTVAGDTAQLIPDSAPPMAQTPSLVTSLGGGLAVPEQTLLLHLNLATQAQAVSLTVSFSSQYAQGVQGVSFTIFDVDFGVSSFQDQLRSISALATDGITQIAPVITTTASHTLTGSGINQVVNGIANTPNTGAGSGNGNVTISFGTNVIRSFSLVYGSGSNAPIDPGTQKIGFHDITFTPVPEVNPTIPSAVSCLLAVALVWRHHAQVRKKKF